MQVVRWAEAYYHWLEPQTREGGHHQRTHADLLQLMHEKEFLLVHMYDENRVADGLELRIEFIHEAGAPYEASTYGPCSVLEVMVAMSRRLAFLEGGSAEGWAWQLLTNLNVVRYADPLSNRQARQVDAVLETLIWRTYAPDGEGGFFPLQWPTEDQRKVELWYQLNAWVNELHR